MARYTGPMTKKSRRLGVYLKGNDKSFEKRPYPPGQHGRGRIKESEYLLQLREKCMVEADRRGHQQYRQLLVEHRVANTPRRPVDEHEKSAAH